MRKRGRPASPSLLTPREQEVLDFLRASLTNPEIGNRLGISVETVKQHVSEILSKLGVATREAAAAWQPEEEPTRRWSFGRIVLGLAGTAAAAAAVATLAPLAWGLSRSDEGDDRAAVAPSATPVVATSDATPSSTPSGNTAPNLLLRDFWMADANSGWMGGASRGCQEAVTGCVGVIFHTSNGGDSWDQQYSGGVQVTAIAFDGQELGFAIGPTGKCQAGDCASGVLRTTDRGLHWDEVMTTPIQLAHLSVIAGDAWVLGDGCAPGQPTCRGDWQLFASTDSGHTWNSSTLPIGGFATDLSRPTANDAWIVTSPAGPGSSQIIVTHDAGRTWQDLPTPENGAGFEQRIFFRSADEGWLVIAGQPGAGSQFKEVFSSTNGGQSWRHLTGSLAPGGSLPDSGLSISGYIGRTVFTTDVDGWMASQRAGVLHSSDGGTNWSLALLDDNLSIVQFTDPEHGWALSLIALWSTADGGATWRSASPPDTNHP